MFVMFASLTNGFALWYTSLCCMLSAITEEAVSSRPFIRASDVVFMYPAEDPSQYDSYSGTVVGWAGRPRTREAQDVAAFRRRVEEGHKRGMRYCGSDDFLFLLVLTKDASSW